MIESDHHSPLLEERKAKEAARDEEEEEEEEEEDEFKGDMSRQYRNPQAAAHYGVLANDHEEEGRERSATRQAIQRMRSTSPGSMAKMGNARWIYAGIALLLSLVSFVVQTENAAYVQKELGWVKPYMMLYMTHGSWFMLFPLQFALLRLRKRHIATSTLFRAHINSIKATARTVAIQNGSTNTFTYFLRTMALIVASLTVAGSTWYIAIDMTTPSDLTAIYNSNAFFAYAFSVPLLGERPRRGKILSVLIAVVGVVIIAYGDSRDKELEDVNAASRFWGNVIIGVGSVMYGLYEVIYKKLACPSDEIGPGRSVVFANTMGACIGASTVLVMWFPIPILHVTGLETFVWPTGEVGRMMWISVISNMTFSGSFLVLIALTSPVLSSVAALLTIFLVALVDWFWTGVPLSPSAIVGGILIMAAFGMLSFATWKEATEVKDDMSIYSDD